MGRLYTENLSGIDGLQLPLEKTEYAENIYWVYGIVLKGDTKLDAEKMMSELTQKGIGTRPFFWPMHEQPVFKKMALFKNERYPVAERIARRGFYLPSGLALREEQIIQVVDAVNGISNGGVE